MKIGRRPRSLDDLHSDLHFGARHAGVGDLRAWRANAFSVLKASFDQELRSLELFASDHSHGVALVAMAHGEPVETCLLVESEIEPNHDVSHWPAGLFVVPEHRRKGAGAVLAER